VQNALSASNSEKEPLALRGLRPLIVRFLYKHNCGLALQASVRCRFTRVNDLHSYPADRARLGRSLFQLLGHAHLHTSDLSSLNYGLLRRRLGRAGAVQNKKEAALRQNGRPTKRGRRGGKTGAVHRDGH
jgi:hypothetical protein